MFEIDHILFEQVHLPILKLGQTGMGQAKQFFNPKQSVDEWNSLSRVAGLMFPIDLQAMEQDPAKKNKVVRLQVPNSKHQYLLFIDEKLPSFTYMPRSFEIFHRLILRAAMAISLEEFKLHKSNC